MTFPTAVIEAHRKWVGWYFGPVQAAAFLVAGAPGAGKSTLAELLLARLTPPPALLDKDTIYGQFVTTTLSVAGRPNGEREGAWYNAHVKPHEYDGLAQTAAQIRAHGCPVLLCAPFTEQIHDQDTWDSYVDALGGGHVELIWVRSDPHTLRTRITARALDRDAGKLQHWDAFLTGVRLGAAPVVAHREIDNRLAAPDLAGQADALLAALVDRRRPSITPVG
ncbi:AAA family ATPase [Longispora sp. NPDC051575]|uniref:AAA family ATPase n=1 Tax=Longispora sp. NPDC051575 TaxID=3154943 RepID=UPI00341CD762